MMHSLRNARSAIRPARAFAGQVRNLSIHEYQSMELLNAYGIPTPASKAAKTPQEAYDVAKNFGKDGLVIKAQVLAGGRGKGKFDTGLQGGVHKVSSPDEAKDFASKMIGSKLITKQTGAAGRVCNAVMLAERRDPTHEYYVAVLNDRNTGSPVIVASAQGGMNIEEVAAKDPSAIITTPVHYKNGLSKDSALELAGKLGLKGQQAEGAADIFINLTKIFREKDATQIEINPMATTADGAVLCMDAKFGFDDNADFRQKDVFALRDVSQEDPTEVEAAKYNLNFIKLDGNVGCLVNGAGLAMATMDVLKLHGGDPANFLDVGGGATPDTVKKAFELLLSDKKVTSIFLNIFGGIMRCDYIAEGVIKATKELQLTVPLVVRLQGTKEKEAKQLIKDSGLKIYAFDGLDEAAAKAVELGRGGPAPIKGALLPIAIVLPHFWAMAEFTEDVAGEHELISTSLELEHLDTRLFRSKSLWTPARARGVFGGQVISQALVAATRCVEEGFSVHSLHCYFLMSADASVPIIYYVEPIRDGRTYCTRSVKAAQNGKWIFMLTCSFQRPEHGQPSHQWPMPRHIPVPDNCPYQEDVFKKYAEKPGISEDVRQMWLQYTAERKRSPVAVKPAGSITTTDGLVQSAFWMRAKNVPTKFHASFQKCVLAYISDLNFIGNAARTVGLHSGAEPPNRLGMISSLDHTIWYYDSDFDCTKWLLFVTVSPRTGLGRGVVHGRVYTEKGKLIAVVAQEGVVRADLSGSPIKKSKAKL